MRIFTPVQPGPGLISTMARPAGGEGLAGELGELAAAGVSVVVSALEPDEEALLDLTGEEGAAGAAGLIFRRAPIPDFGVPTEDLRPVLDEIRDHMRAGRHVVVHCRGGRGRSSMLAAAVLARSGVPLATVWTNLIAARGYRVPETEEQGNWVKAQLR